jgi:glycerophosphoryl diester phosphodiesterase
MIVGLLLIQVICGAADTAARVDVFVQAHRGGLKEVAENTMAGYRHAWNIPGAIPEIDVCTTADGAYVCMHDDTPRRTTNAPAPYCDMPIAKLTLEQIRQWDAGSSFDAKYAGERVPLLTEVFGEMKGRPERQAYLDLKDIDFQKLLAMIRECGIEKQVIFVHGSPARCLELSKLYEGARTMTWLSGNPETIQARFEKLAAEGFRGISQLQLHLNVRPGHPVQFLIDDAFLAHAVKETSKAGTALQVRPFDFDVPSLQRLLELGIRWFVADEPQRFYETLKKCKS